MRKSVILFLLIFISIFFIIISLFSFNKKLGKNDYDIETPEYIKHNINVFQAFLLSDDEVEHCKKLYHIFNPKKGGIIIDMGCGVGEISNKWRKIDPTLKPICITNSKVQYDIVNKKNIPVLLTDYHSVPIQDEYADMVMFLESIGYGDIEILLKESYRLLKKGGKLFIRDWFSKDKDFRKSEGWDYKIFSLKKYEDILKKLGFHFIKIVDLTKIGNYKKCNNFVRNSSLIQEYHGILFFNVEVEVDYPFCMICEKI